MGKQRRTDASSIADVTFDSATFYYAATAHAGGLTEMMDDIRFEVGVAVVPAPGAILLGTLGARRLASQTPGDVVAIP